MRVSLQQEPPTAPYPANPKPGRMEDPQKFYIVIFLLILLIRLCETNTSFICADKWGNGESGSEFTIRAGGAKLFSSENIRI